jgi:endonuclease III
MKKPVAPASPAPDAAERRRARAILHRLEREFPDARTPLIHDSPFQLLVATILSAQCTDERVNMVVPGLFKEFPDTAAFAAARPAHLEKLIRSTGFFRMKAKNIIACSRALMEKHGGEVPQSIEELVALPGVGRKTANVVLGQAFGIPSGVVVDTHVHRLSQRLGFTRADTPEKIEQDLMRLFPQGDWITVASTLIFHGRKTCKARRPLCDVCMVRELCPSAALYLKGR